VRNSGTLKKAQMRKDTLNIQRILYVLLLAALNVIAIIMVGVVFLSASNANGEGAPIQNAFIFFLRQLVYVVIISLFFSSIAFLLTRLFRNTVSRNNLFVNKIFWLEFSGMIAIFLIAYLYLLIKFAL
jgi:magnesium-transporting ATPase (P-type)